MNEYQPRRSNFEGLRYDEQGQGSFFMLPPGYDITEDFARGYMRAASSHLAGEFHLFGRDEQGEWKTLPIAIYSNGAEVAEEEVA